MPPGCSKDKACDKRGTTKSSILTQCTGEGQAGDSVGVPVKQPRGDGGEMDVEQTAKSYDARVPVACGDMLLGREASSGVSRELRAGLAWGSGRGGWPASRESKGRLDCRRTSMSLKPMLYVCLEPGKE
jgi:hypothetical protein